MTTEGYRRRIRRFWYLYAVGHSIAYCIACSGVDATLGRILWSRAVSHERNVNGPDSG